MAWAARPARQPRTVSDEQVTDPMATTLERTPNTTHWSTRSMAEKTGLSAVDGLPRLETLRPLGNTGIL